MINTPFIRTILTAIAVVGISSVWAFAMPSERFEGTPTIDESKPALAVYIWNIRDTSYVRFLSDQAEQRFTGTICSAGRIEIQKRYKLEPDDALHPRRKGTCLAFEFQTGVGVDGFDFQSRGGEITYDVQRNGAAMSPKRIFLGAKGVHPRRIPFTQKR